MVFSGSDQNTGESLSLFPAASNGEFGLPPELVPVLKRGAGCTVWDTEGRDYLDMTMAWGAALVGHARPEVVEAATAQAAQGANFAAVNDRMVELAGRIAALSPCIERIRFVASGTEATLMCLRVARGATGRRLVLKFEGAYHGQHPEGVAAMVGAGLCDFPRCHPSGTGASWVERDVIIAPYNDLVTTDRIVQSHKAELAGIIVEPLHRCIPPAEGFLQGLRALADDADAALVFDEVVTGFRLAPGGAQEYYGVSPDLVAYGKALGGGFPIGAYGGRADLMDVVSEDRYGGEKYIWSASTAGGNPVSCAAALATLDVLCAASVHTQLHALGQELRGRMAAVLDAEGETALVLGDGPLAQVAFSRTPINDTRAWLAADRARGRALMLALVREGVFLNPMGTKLYVSLAHDNAALDRFEAAFARALYATRCTARPVD